MSSTQFECLLQCGKPCEASDSCDHITKEVWGKLKSKSLNWKGCDKFENVYDTVNWDLGPCGKYVHNNCRIDIASSQKLNRSKIGSESGRENQHLMIIKPMIPPVNTIKSCPCLHQSVFDQAQVLCMTNIFVCGA